MPNWLNFNQTEKIFTGNASTANTGVYTVNVTGADPFGATAARNINLIVEGAPRVVTKLSSLAANVGSEFIFIVPENTFENPHPDVEDAIIYTASLTTGAVLPAWLAFDPATRTFTGIPGRKDTDLFSNRPLPIQLTARNNIGTASLDFIINVQGESDATLAIKIISRVGAMFAMDV